MTLALPKPAAKAPSESDNLAVQTEWWRRWLIGPDAEFDDEDEGELDPVEVAAVGLAALQQATDVALAEVDQKTLKQGARLGGRISVLQQRLHETETERQRLADEASAMGERIKRLEAETKAANVKLTEAAKAIANIELSAARDRSYVRMINERRFAPISETTALAEARRRTDLAVKGVEWWKQT